MQHAFGNAHIEPVTYGGRYLSAEEVGQLAGLMQELRELTQSRRTFAAANELLSRLTSEAQQPHLVPQDAPDYY